MGRSSSAPLIDLGPISFGHIQSNLPEGSNERFLDQVACNTTVDVTLPRPKYRSRHVISIQMSAQNNERSPEALPIGQHQAERVILDLQETNQESIVARRQQNRLLYLHIRTRYADMHNFSHGI